MTDFECQSSSLQLPSATKSRCTSLSESCGCLGGAHFSWQPAVVQANCREGRLCRGGRRASAAAGGSSGLSTAASSSGVHSGSGSGSGDGSGSGSGEGGGEGRCCPAAVPPEPTRSDSAAAAPADTPSAAAGDCSENRALLRHYRSTSLTG